LNRVVRLFSAAISPIAIPGILFAGIYFLLSNLEQLPPIPQPIWEAGPFFILLILTALSAAFSRSRIFFSSILLWLLAGLKYAELSGEIESLTLFVLFPVNMTLILSYKERGIFTVAGFIRSAFLLMQIALIYFVSVDPELTGKLSELFLYQPLSGEIAILLAYSPLNQPITLILTVSGFLLVGLMYWQNSPTARGIVWATTAVLVSSDMQLVYAQHAYSMAASILLCVAILRDSYTMAYLDELTSLPQRRALNEQLISLGNHYSIAMLDVDHFKKFNDTHGHDVGDQVLQMVATKIGQVKGGGKAYRYGGEEFTIVFNRRSQSEIVYFLEQVRKSIETYEMVIRQQERPEDEKVDRSKRSRGSFHKAEKKVSVAISIGVAERSIRGETPEDVLKKADGALYKAKKAGRNQVKEA
jgi:GGDEF domain-containing protein